MPLRRPSNCELAYKTTKVIKRFTTQAPTYPVAQPPLLYRLQLAPCPRAAVCLPHTLRVPMRARARDRNSGNCSLPLLSLSSAMRRGRGIAGTPIPQSTGHAALLCEFLSGFARLQQLAVLSLQAGSHNLRDRLSHLQVVCEGLRINKSSCHCALTHELISFTSISTGRLMRTACKFTIMVKSRCLPLSPGLLYTHIWP